MIPAVTFTHSGGALRIPWWVAGVRMAGFVPVVCDDGRDPLPGNVLGWLHAQGVDYRQTAWDRRGNLNGTDAAAGICAEVAAACGRHRSRYGLKVDDDTAVLDPELFTCAEQAAAVGLTWSGGRPGAFGMAYALRADVAAAVARHLTCLPLDPAAPEDLTVWSAAKALAGPEGVIQHEFDIEAGPFAALPWGSCVRDAVGRYGVITVGNHPPGGWTDRPRETAEALRQVVCMARAEAMQPARGSRPPQGAKGRVF